MMQLTTNWIATENAMAFREDAQAVLKKLKSGRAGKKYRLVKVCDKPLTFKEEEIK